MNKKEVLEIKKQFTPENCAITRICGCYVNHEKEKKLEMKKAFLSMSEEETFKYYDIFKQTLSGTVGKNLINLEFSQKDEKPGGTQDFLLKLRNSKLQDDALLEEYYDKIINSYEYGENYYIILIHGIYDIPGKSSDGLELFDASENVYDYLLCSICPVNLSKPGLSYNSNTNDMEERIRDWVVNPPENGFLFPAFNDRNTDIHGAMYYAKKPEVIQTELLETMLTTEIPLTAETQKNLFNSIISETLGENCDYNIVRDIHDNLNELANEHKDQVEPLELSKKDMERLLKNSGVSEENMNSFEQEYEAVVGDEIPLLVSNIVNDKKFNIETPNISIKVKADRSDLIETRIIDERQYLVIAIDDQIELNGVMVKHLKIN